MNEVSGYTKSSTLHRRALLVSATSLGIGIAAGLGRLPRETAAQAEGPFDVTDTTVDWVTGTTALSRPHCMALSPSGRLHIVDADRQVIAVFDEGAFVREWDDPAISGPIAAIAIDGRGYVYLADAEAHAIRAYDAAGRPQVVIEKCADGTRFMGITDLMFAGDGALYVADADGARVLKLHLRVLGQSPDDAYLPHQPHPLP